MSLHELAKNTGTDKDTIHSYLDVYQELFVSKKESAREVLEIGILDGSSLRMWESFFANANITGLDISSNPIGNKNRIRSFITNAYTEDIVKTLSDRQYDIMIDDGPHTLNSMMFFAKHYSPLLASDGICVIEDVQDIRWCDSIISAFPEEFRSQVKVLDRRNIKGRYDDILIILDRRSSP